MLVLSRNINQEVVIDQSIRVMVLEIRGDRVRLGITAPVDVPVRRAELNKRVKIGMKADEIMGGCPTSLFHAG